MDFMLFLVPLILFLNKYVYMCENSIILAFVFRTTDNDTKYESRSSHMRHVRRAAFTSRHIYAVEHRVRRDYINLKKKNRAIKV